MLEEEFVDELADRGLGLLHDELPILPEIPIWGLPAQGLTELGADRDRSRNARGDLLALPLRHGGDHGVEEAAGRGGGVDALAQAHEVCLVVTEVVGELQELLGVAGEARELREDEAGDPAALHVPKHPLRFRMLHDGFAAYGFQAIHLGDLPAFGFSI